MTVSKNEKLNALLDFAREDLDGNLMKWWCEHTVDNKRGGFYGAVKYDNTPDENAHRFIVLNARLVWTFSACYETTKKEIYKELAQRAYDYFTKYFYDETHGGFYMNVDCDGRPAAPHKFVYGNTFAIYGLSEYARVFKNEDAKQLATETAALLDNNLWDTQHKGYYESASRDWHYTPHNKLMQGPNGSEKTMNTHLHLIEAYTNLLRAGECKQLRSRVRELLYLFLNKIINNDNWHFNYFQTRDWAPVTAALTFGHDIEGSWLLYETAEALNEKEAVADARRACVNMARAVYDDGIAANGACIAEYEPHGKKYTEHFGWWEQNEAVVGFLNVYGLTGEEKFLDASYAAMMYIKNNFIDKKYGGWYARIDANGNPIQGSKCSGYVCPYHNARMSIEIIKRIGK